MIWGSGGSKSRLAKAAGAEPAGQMREEKLHAVVARSTFGSQHVKNTRGSDHFWKLRCRKSARRCGAKHISKSKCTKHTILGPLLEVEMLKSARRCGAKHISKSKCTKHQGFGPLLELEMSKKCTPLWREAHFQVKMYKAHHSRTTFGSWDDEKVHAVVARSTFPSQNVKNTRVSDHFWRFGCRKSARRCGAKNISKSKCTKHTRSGPLLVVEMLKKCTPLWREAHFKVKMLKTQGFRTTFGGSDVEKVHAVVARRTFRSQNVQSTRGSEHFWRLRCRFASIHYTTGHYTTLHSTTLQLHNYTPLHSTTLNYTTLHYTKLHYTTLHYTTLRSTTLHYTTLHYITLHYTPLQLQLHSTTLNYTTLRYITLHYTPLHYITLHYLPRHFTTLHYATLHYTTTTQLHSTTLNYTTLHYNYTTTQLHNYTPLHSTTLHYTERHCTTDRQVDR